MSPSSQLTHLSPSQQQAPLPPSSIAEWARICVNIPGVRVQCLQRESGIDIICEGEVCPEVSIAIDRLTEGLRGTNLQTFLPPGSPPLLMVNVHGRTIGEKRPNWTVRLDPLHPETAAAPLDNVEMAHFSSLYEPNNPKMSRSDRDRHNPPLPFSQEGFGGLNAPQNPPEVEGELGTNDRLPSSGAPKKLNKKLNWEAARQGNSRAIAGYLTQTLKSWGLGVKVIVKIQTLEKPNPEAEDPATDRVQSKLQDPSATSKTVNPWSPANLNAKFQNPMADPPELRGGKGGLSDPNKQQPITNNPQTDRPQKRLWVVCQSAYSPEPLSIAPPLGARLRELDLPGFKDAVILGQVSGEKKPEWILRVDLTPATQMLEDWARWGDVQAIVKLLHQRLIEALPGSFAEELQVSGVLKESTLHVFFSDPGFAMESAAYGAEYSTFNKEAVKAAIAPLLERIAPQNIYGITIYGLRGDAMPESNSSIFLKNPGSDDNEFLADATPLWVDWLDLPASRHANLAYTPMELACSGDLAALNFLIDRLINPDLDRKLNTGGIAHAIRHKADLLHIMVDAATCPPRAVGAKIAKFIASLNMPQIGGVRTYGRRSGQKQSQWRYGLDFQSRESRSEIAPEFKVSEPASNASSADLLPQPGNLVIHPDLNSDDLQACLTVAPGVGVPSRSPLRKKKEADPNLLKQGLTLSGIFIPANSTPNNNLTSAKLITIWGLLGLLFTLQADWLLGELVQLRQYNLAQSTAESTQAQSTGSAKSPDTQNQGLTDPQNPPKPPLTKGGSAIGLNDRKATVFDASNFTQPWDLEPVAVPAKPAKEFKYPTFNSQQMDEQLATYAQYVATYGVPDVLIVGSSRALRGVDPAVLRRGLDGRYPNLRVFNFGVNGATAQVVDSIVRKLLGPEQLPRLIIWADGARAFNSGRVDRTFEAIANSLGYQDLQLGLRPTIVAPEVEEDSSLASLSLSLADRAKQGLSFTDAYQQLDRWLNEQFGSLSASYVQRDELNQWFADGLRYSISERSHSLVRNSESCWPVFPSCDRTAGEGKNPLDSSVTADPKSATYINGFLPINLQFDRVTYYQQYAFVSGDYDADYESFNLTGQQTAATRNLLSFLAQHQVSLVFVNMPLTEDYLDPIRLNYERLFQKYMLGLALQYGFIFRDFSQEWPNEHHYFSDPSHLNTLGAQRVSERLYQDPLIPWPNNKSKD